MYEHFKLFEQLQCFFLISSSFKVFKKPYHRTN